MTQSNPYHEAASRGAALLDERNPGWWRRIDLDKLNVRSIHCCPLGQVYGRYGPGIDALKLIRLSDRSLSGFSIGPVGDYEDVVSPERQAKWAQLTEAWKSIIRARLEVDR